MRSRRYMFSFNLTFIIWTMRSILPTPICKNLGNLTNVCVQVDVFFLPDIT